MVFHRKSLREGIVRGDKARLMRLGKGVTAIDKPIKELGEKFRGTSGLGGRVGKIVKPIDKSRKNIFDPMGR